jgi:hypothetical protein
MKKSIQVLISIVLLSVFGYGQDINIGIQSGIGSYKMKSLHNLNKSMASPLPTDDAVISDLPPYVYLQAEADLGFLENRFSIGILVSAHSTGSRVYYSDYSGLYRCDMKISDYTVGSIFKARVFRFSKFDVDAYSEFGFSTTTLNTEEFFQIGTSSIERKQTYDSSPAYFEPGIRINYSLKKMSVGLNAGYAINIGDTFTIIGNEIVILRNPWTGENIVSDWSGFRLGINVSFKLFTVKSHHPSKQ